MPTVTLTLYAAENGTSGVKHETVVAVSTQLVARRTVGVKVKFDTKFTLTKEKRLSTVSIKGVPPKAGPFEMFIAVIVGFNKCIEGAEADEFWFPAPTVT